MSSARGFQRFAWASLAYTGFVILFGAVVRITGSGAGCGQHWPTCQGEIAHLPRSVETAIELTHRVTSGLSLVLAVVLFVLARRRFERGQVARRAAGLTLLFMVIEALIGAALVLLALVGNNDSALRAAVMAAHLVNTSLLTAALAITAWAAGKSLPVRWNDARATRTVLGLALVGMLVVSTTGAVTALGDTLYPVTPGARFEGTHFLQRLRVLHPVLAIAVAGYLCYAIAALAAPDKRAPARVAFALVFTQVGAGVLNVLLSAPAWLQVVHLALATALWIALVLLGAEALSRRELSAGVAAAHPATAQRR
jgi:heme A synthase